jgi:hypothetical protein
MLISFLHTQGDPKANPAAPTPTTLYKFKNSTSFSKIFLYRFLKFYFYFYKAVKSAVGGLVQLG